MKKPRNPSAGRRTPESETGASLAGPEAAPDDTALFAMPAAETPQKPLPPMTGSPRWPAEIEAALRETHDHLRLSWPRKREILWAATWRGIVYSAIALAGTACFTYLYSEFAWQFFLNAALKLNKDEAAFLYLWLAIPAIFLGWVLALNRVLHMRFSHFRIALTPESRRKSWLGKISGGSKGKRRRH